MIEIHEPYPIKKINEYCIKQGINVSIRTEQDDCTAIYWYLTFNNNIIGFVYGKYDDDCHISFNWYELVDKIPTNIFLRLLQYLHIKKKETKLHSVSRYSKIIKKYKEPFQTHSDYYITLEEIYSLIDKSIIGYKLKKEDDIKIRLKKLKDDFK